MKSLYDRARRVTNMKSLYDRARRITNVESDLDREKDRPPASGFFFSNNAMATQRPLYKQRVTWKERRGCQREQGDKPRVVTIPYVSGLSEDIRRVCRRFNIKTALKGNWHANIFFIF